MGISWISYGKMLNHPESSVFVFSCTFCLCAKSIERDPKNDAQQKIYNMIAGNL